MRPRRFLTACTSALILWTTGLAAQDRFQVLEQNVVAGAPGLSIVTVRDNHLSQCYTLFIVESPPAVDVIPPQAVADEVPDESVQRIREAAERRDAQLADLKTKAERSGFWDPFVVARYETDRTKIEDEYEQVLQAEIPGRYSWGTYFPGMRNGGWEPAAGAVRQAIVDPNPGSTITTTDQFAWLGDYLARSLQAPRVAASGPVKCGTDAAEVKKPLRPRRAR
jgi:hypothetical protein